MTSRLFSEDWAVALGGALRVSDAFRRAARTWEGAVVLDWSDAPPSHAENSACGVYLDLRRGDCRASRMASAADYEAAQYVLSADLESWNAMLQGRLAPTTALLFGRMKLKKGSVMALMPHVGMATELIRVAQGVGDTTPLP